MNVQELETAKRLKAAIVVVVLVDGRLGVIEVNERRLFGRTFGTAFGNPDFVQLARAFGIAGFAVTGVAGPRADASARVRPERAGGRRRTVGSHRERSDRGRDPRLKPEE